MSIQSAERRLPSERIAPAAAGAANCTTDCSVALIPLTRMSCSSGTNCGRMAPTAGICIPAPMERMTEANSRATSTGVPSPSEGSSSARTSVATAIAASAPMISRFLERRSASAPETNEISVCGRNVQTVSAAIQPPDAVFSVTYQTMANETTEEPKSVMHWPTKKSAVFRFQMAGDCVFGSCSIKNLRF